MIIHDVFTRFQFLNESDIRFDQEPTFWAHKLRIVKELWSSIQIYKDKFL